MMVELNWIFFWDRFRIQDRISFQFESYLAQVHDYMVELSRFSGLISAIFKNCDVNAIRSAQVERRPTLENEKAISIVITQVIANDPLVFEHEILCESMSAIQIGVDDIPFLCHICTTTINPSIRYCQVALDPFHLMMTCFSLCGSVSSVWWFRE